MRFNHRLATYSLLALCAACSATMQPEARSVVAAKESAEAVSAEIMADIYETIKTPFKYGVVLKGEPGNMVDSPSVFRHGDKWYMTYIIFDGRGYETALAESEDLLNWNKLGKILEFTDNTWDANQAAGYIALQDHQWQGSYELGQHDGKYWMSYLGGNSAGYEKGVLSIGLAATDRPTVAGAWTRFADNPVLTPKQRDAREFENVTLYKSHILHDASETLGYPYVMYYNAKGEYESIGMAVSRDMTTWQRYGTEPVIDNGSGISGDPQITKIGDVWVMFYFGAFWQPNAFETFAASYDLVHWTKWTGPHLIEPSEPWDEQYAHKPWVIVHDDVVYHFYNAVGDQGRVIAVATSKDLSPAVH
jgi:predicted GH43/DUF377 family glycosyl hydrolase